jgi:sec-independent protein translocase protein TatC
VSLTLRGRPIRFSLKWLKPPPSPPDGSMTLFEHLRELRYRLIVAVLAFFIGTVICWFFRDLLLELLERPYSIGVEALKAKYPDANPVLYNPGITSPFTLALKVSGVAGAVLTSPVWLYQLWAFIVPGLLAKEKKWSLIFIGTATPLFLAGVLVGYIVVPKGITVLLGFTKSGVANLQSFPDFLSFLLRIMIVFGIAFLIPLIVLMLNIVGVVKAKQLSKYRSYVIFGCFVFGAVATPSTDPFSMLALALPMAVLFVATEVIARLLDRRRARRLAVGGSEAAGIEGDAALRELSDPNRGEPESRP